MPIYEYRCQQCGHELEKLQRMTDAPLLDCPACEQPGLRRLISAAGFRLKGSGWYETDFKQGKKRNLAEGGGEAKAEGQAKQGEGSAKTAAPKDAGSGKPAGGSSAAAPQGT
jgi:putative FmdB family regulatory protein